MTDNTTQDLQSQRLAGPPKRLYLVPKPGTRGHLRRRSHVWEPDRQDTACLLGRACYNPALYELADHATTELCWNCVSCDMSLTVDRAVAGN